MVYQNALGEEIKSYCILDSDYHTQKEINERYEEAKEKKLNLHIWTQKEIENYLLIPNVISRLINMKSTCKNNSTLSPEKIKEKIKEFSDSLYNEIFDAFATEFYSLDRSKGQKGANTAAREHIEKFREKNGNIILISSGKTIISKLSDWCKTNYGVSFSAISIAREILPNEIMSEMKHVVDSIENGKQFNITHINT